MLLNNISELITINRVAFRRINAHGQTTHQGIIQSPVRIYGTNPFYRTYSGQIVVFLLPHSPKEEMRSTFI